MLHNLLNLRFLQTVVCGIVQVEVHALRITLAQWRWNEFESGGHRSGAKVGGPIRHEAPENFFGRAPPLFGSKTQLVVLVSFFVMHSTV